MNTAQPSKGKSALAPNKAVIVRDAVASVIDDLDERPDDRTIMLMRHAAQRAANAYEHETLTNS